MLLTLTTTPQPDRPFPATDLGYLLHKHPERVLERDLPFGRATVFYPEATPEVCTAALLLEVDPVALSRHTRPEESSPLEPYVNDRPYAAGSFLAVALRDAYGTAMTGRSKERQALADTPLPLVAELPCVAARGPADLPERLFGPLGYAVEAEAIPLDPLFPEWGERPYVRLRVSGTVRLRDLLAHLYVLLPVLDGKKHYYIADDEVDKLLRHGSGWLETHPERELILSRFLRFRALVRQAAASLTSGEEVQAEAETAAQPRPRVHDARLDRVAEVLKATGSARVLDLGCGEGKLLRRLVEVGQFRDIVGVDIQARSLEIAADKLNLKERPELAARVRLLHGSLAYRDSRLRGFDAAALVEVIEHLEPHRLETLTGNVLGDARPRTLVVTTPNREYNAVFAEQEGEERMRHADHRFEWTRAEFRAWAEGAGEQYGYAVRYEDLGDVHPEYGPLTQMAVFERKEAGA